MTAPFPWAARSGAIVPYEELTLHAESMAMRYALSAFEGVRGYTQLDGRPVRYFSLPEHLSRLQRTLQLAGLPPVRDQEVATAADELLKVNSVHADCYLRIAVSATSLGTLKAGVETEVFASLQPMGRKELPEHGIKVAISQWRKPHDDMFPQSAKVICNYAGPRLAYLQAKAMGFDDVILTTSQGLLAEAPTANLFLVRDGVLLTPRQVDGILPGITRDCIIRLSRQMGWPVEECAVTADDAYSCNEAFLCGTGLELASIRQFDEHPLPRERSVFCILCDAYFALVRSGEGRTL